jgi:thioredoxin reductase (NADPH)
MQKKLFNNEKIKILWDTVATEVLGDKMVTGLKIKNVKTDEEGTLEVSGLFYAVGHKPNTDFLDGQITLDETGYIKTVPGTTKTNVDGVFACGDVQDKRYRQAVTAAGTGCMAALEAEKYLED